MRNVLVGDSLDVLRAMPEASVDSIVTDPPYGLRFMGKKWDYDVPTTGSTGVAAVLEGFRFIGVELEPDYARIAQQRITSAKPRAGVPA